MNNKIAFIVDSTTIVPEEFVQAFRYEQVSLHVMIEGKEERELDLKDEDIISRLESTKFKIFSSPSTGEFLLALEKLFSEGYEDIIIMTMSKENSTTYNVANMAIDSLDDDQKNHVYNVDTNINNYGITNILIALFLLER